MHKQYLSEIEKLYIKQYDMLLTYAAHMLRDASLAEEAVQETFRIACQKADTVYKSDHKEGWLLNTLKNVILNMEKMQFRASRKMTEYAMLLASFPEKNNDIDLDILYKDLASSGEYVLIKELVLEQKSIQEMAESRGISVAACKKRVQRAKQVLRKRLKSIDDS